MNKSNRNGSYRAGSGSRRGAENGQKPPTIAGRVLAENDGHAIRAEFNQAKAEIEKLKKELLMAHRENVKLKATIEFRDE